MRRFWKYGVVLGIGMAAMGEASAQAVPNAPDAPVCEMKDGKSTCQFKIKTAGTATSVVGNRVILFNRSVSGGHGDSRNYIAASLRRLADRHKFTATITEDPAIFTAANLANTRAVIMSNGDGDVVPPGANRTALENFQQVNGWGVIWIHAACAFISSGWPFGQQSCVQQYFHHNGSGTPRRVFVDSGTTASPNHGIKNPQSEFLMKAIPGWTNRTFTVGDEYYCFRAPARNTQGVNVLMGYDRASGLPPGGCPDPSNAGIAGSQNHNLAWTRMMGKGITLYNSMGHDEATYTAGGNMGDSLLWRFIRYAAKDWCVTGKSDAECEVVTSVNVDAKPILDHSVASGSLALSFKDPSRNAVTISDVSGKQVYSRIFAGVERAEVPGLRRGIYFVRVASSRQNEVKQVRIL